MKWIEGICRREKFFLLVDCFDPHEPWDPPDEYYKIYKNPRYDGPKPMWGGFLSGTRPDIYTEEELHEVKALYAGEVTFVDHWVGHLLNKIDRLGLKEDTLIIFTSDHGTHLGEAHVKGHISKTTFCYREISRIPLIIRCPEGPKGKRIRDVISLPDVMPTILDILGVEPPVPIHGKSFWPLIKGEGEKHRGYIVSGWVPTFPHRFYMTDGEWSYIHSEYLFPNLPSEGNRLFNLKEDPDEQNNVLEQNKDVAERMEQRFKQYLEETEKMKY